MLERQVYDVSCTIQKFEFVALPVKMYGSTDTFFFLLFFEIQNYAI